MDYQQLFFNISEPCPAAIPNCENLRKEYLNELNELKTRGGCTACMEDNLKQKYVMFIMAVTKP